MGKMRRKTLPAFLTGFLCCLLAVGAGIEAAGDQAPKTDANKTISVSQNVKLEVKDLLEKNLEKRMELGKH